MRVVHLGKRRLPPRFGDRLRPRLREEGTEVAFENTLIKNRQVLMVRKLLCYDRLGESACLLRRPWVREAGKRNDSEDGLLAEVGRVILRKYLQDLESEWCYLPALLRNLLVFQGFFVCCTQMSEAACLGTLVE